MRVGLDVSPLVRPHPRGIVRVVRGLAAALERRANVELVRLAPEPGVHLVRWRQVELPRVERRLGLTGIHSCVSAFALRGAGLRVQTIHELPWLYGESENAGWRHRLWARYGPRRARLVLTATATTARDVRAWSGAPATRVSVVPWGVDAVFSASPSPADERALARFGLARERYVLVPGGTRPKKRALAALAGAQALRQRGGPELAVVVTGPGEAPAGCKSAGELADEDLAALVRHATATCALARSEGFALPVLEAFACGTAAIVPRAGAQAEVAGGEGIAADPDDPASIADALAIALASRARAPQRRARAAEFSWDRCAAAVEALWMELAQ